MADQQGNANVDLSWLAGFIDGEGCFHFRRTAGHRLRSMGAAYYYPAIRVCNTHQPTLQTVIDILDASGLPYHVSHRIYPSTTKYLPAWDVEAHGMKRCRRWLLVITPYLHTKRQQAELMLEYCDLRLTAAQGTPFTPREAEIREQFGRPTRASLTDYTVGQPA